MLDLDQNLFWDTDFNNLNCEKHADFIIKRVLEYGDLKDYQTIKERYGLKKIKEVARKTKFHDKKTANFWQLMFK